MDHAGAFRLAEEIHKGYPAFKVGTSPERYFVWVYDEHNVRHEFSSIDEWERYKKLALQPREKNI